MNSLIGLKPFDCKHWFEQWIDLIYKRHIDSGVGKSACNATYKWIKIRFQIHPEYNDKLDKLDKNEGKKILVNNQLIQILNLKIINNLLKLVFEILMIYKSIHDFSFILLYWLNR